MKDVGYKLRTIRKNKKFKIVDVAEAAGIANSTLSYIEKGTNIPTVDTLDRICRALGITIVEFFDEEVVEKQPDLHQIIEKLHRLPPKRLKILNTVLDDWIDSD